jgi:hypothetical protein
MPILSDGLLQLTDQGIIEAASVVPATAPDFFTNDLRLISSIVNLIFGVFCHEQVFVSLNGGQTYKKNGRSGNLVWVSFYKIKTIFTGYCKKRGVA